MFSETCFPLNWDASGINTIANNILKKDKGYILAPYLKDFELQAVKRNYSINTEKTS
jgi:hypothetical protein